MRTRRALALLVAGALTVAGCSDADGGADDAEADATTTTAAETTTTLDPEDPASVAADPSAGCGTEPDVDPVGEDLPGDVELTFTSGGVERIYRLGVPVDHDPEIPAPLVVNLHGSGSDAAQASTYGDVPRRASERGVVTVAPQGIDGQWELGDGADTDFLNALLDDVESRYCIDRNRVHGVGMSLGAAKIAFHACGEGDRFASLALVTVEIFSGTCRSMPVIAFHGTDDPVVAYGEGGGTVDDAATPNAGLPGTLDNIAAWAGNAGCAAEPDISMIGDDVEVRSYPGCDEGVDVALYTIRGGGHTWPGSAIDIGPPEWTTDTIDATDLALDWFEDHPRRV
jgi:polyhydroxybutyrate depolymerase